MSSIGLNVVMTNENRFPSQNHWVEAFMLCSWLWFSIINSKFCVHHFLQIQNHCSLPLQVDSSFKKPLILIKSLFFFLGLFTCSINTNNITMSKEYGKQISEMYPKHDYNDCLHMCSWVSEWACVWERCESRAFNPKA